MARIQGIEIPTNKRIEISLTYIYGIGRSRSRTILSKLNIPFDTKVKELDEKSLNELRTFVEKNYTLEGELRTQKAMSIKRYIDINSYQGMRHRRNLPLRGQRTKTNAKTRKHRRIR